MNQLLGTRDVGDHVGEQRVAGDVERDSQAHVARPLVELARELAVSHVELKTNTEPPVFGNFLLSLHNESQNTIS